MSDRIVLSETQNGVTTITLNRPDKFNALTAKMNEQIAMALLNPGFVSVATCPEGGLTDRVTEIVGYAAVLEFF